MDNFNLTIQNAVVSIVDHQDAKIKTIEALQHVILKCSENIDLYIKVSFGTSGRALLTPQVKYVILFFYVFVEILCMPNVNATLFFQILLKFLSESGGSKMATALNFHKSTGQLTISHRRHIIHSVIDYMVKEYGYYPNQDTKKEVAKVVVTLFPCLAKKQ